MQIDSENSSYSALGKFGLVGKRKGRGKKKEEVGGRLDFVWNEPFNTIDLINWEELVHISKEDSSRESKFSIAKDREASPNP